MGRITRASGALLCASSLTFAACGDDDDDNDVEDVVDTVEEAIDDLQDDTTP
jgi:hypothetical protein